MASAAASGKRMPAAISSGQRSLKGKEKPVPVGTGTGGRRGGTGGPGAGRRSGESKAAQGPPSNGAVRGEDGNPGELRSRDSGPTALGQTGTRTPTNLVPRVPARGNLFSASPASRGFVTRPAGSAWNHVAIRVPRPADRSPTRRNVHGGWLIGTSPDGPDSYGRSRIFYNRPIGG